VADRPLVLICPRIPPVRDGVGDYTYRLALELATRHPVTIITTDGQATTAAGCRVESVPDWTSNGIAVLRRLLRDLKPAFINVQWVPFLWGRWGVNVAMPRAAMDLRREGYRVVTTIHEPYVPFDMWRRLPMGVMQRLELAMLVCGSAKVAFTISAWTRMFQSRFFWRRRDIFWLPVGSNIPRLALDDAGRAEIRRSVGIAERDVVVAMFNPQGAGKMPALGYAAWDAIRREQPSARLLLIGCEAHELSSRPSGFDRVVCTGYARPDQASRLLSSADLCLAAYVDGVSARRGAAMAAMEHGLPIVSTRGALTDRGLFEDSPLALVDVNDEGGFIDAAVRLARDEQARTAKQRPTREFYERHFSWPIIADRLLEHCAPA
jgi:glycosyltransferase involved in cell wall biosynthesis